MNACKLVLVTTKSLLESLPELSNEVPVLLARRTVQLSKLEQIMDLAPGTRCLFVSNSIHTVNDTVELLNRLGFDHLHFIPYVPNSDIQLPEKDQIDVAITHGLKELVPAAIEKIIDLETRPLDLTTIFDIARLLKLPMEKHTYILPNFSGTSSD
ncbi:hypothetical protein [Effusibacillus dendaii]|uniref:Uncharacterized protein n=1 Tax=Effusibacillus dendaii TaxID=2743772 RepID=A0A7I8DGD8_9BACL|nr:hypothetical protein [Effusibacillus dendaii]BCJ88039.1 hypothetical protein skT53_30240 [Effusibacillus dendaii]